MAPVFALTRINLIFWIVSLLVASMDAGLYSSTDDVRILNGYTFRNVIFGAYKSRVWVVEFYNTWCGHCVRFAPVWKKLASSIKDWHTLIDIAVVDCADENNTDICREYDIKAYPSIKFFPPYSHPGVKDLLLTNPLQDVDNLRHDVIDGVQNMSLTAQLTPLRKIEDVWSEIKQNTKHVLVFFEESQSYIGREVILDLIPYPQVLIRRVLKDDVHNMAITSFPSLYKLNPNEGFEDLGKDLSREDFVSMVLSLDDVTRDPRNDGQIVYTAGIEDSAPKLSEMKTEGKASSSPVIHLQDLESAIVCSLRREVALQKDIRGAKLSALRAYISVLDKYFPSRPAVKNFLSHIHSWLMDIKVSITGDEWTKRINLIQSHESSLPREPHWIGCAGSTPKFRGYPCGMWQLFHTLTVNAVIKYEHNKHFNAREVLYAMRGYIREYFGCHECAVNFAKMAAKIDVEVSSPNEGILWLWRAHNKANARLRGDETEDPLHRKIQFPSRDMCPVCAPQGSVRSAFNEKMVLSFLKHIYGNSNLRKVHKQDTAVDASDSKPLANWWKDKKHDLSKIGKLRQAKKAKVADKPQTVMYNTRKVKAWKRHEYNSRNVTMHASVVMASWGFNKVDISLCVVLYVMGTVIILLLYFHFTVNRKMRPRICPLL